MKIGVISATYIKIVDGIFQVVIPVGDFTNKAFIGVLKVIGAVKN